MTRCIVAHNLMGIIVEGGWAVVKGCEVQDPPYPLS